MRLFITHDAPGPQWQLGSPSSKLGAFALVGWSLDDFGGGIPEPIVNVVARSLVVFGRVTFACSTIPVSNTPGWQMQGVDFVSRYRTRSVFGRMAARFSDRAPVDLLLLSTRSEQTVQRLFDDPGYPWWNQGQFVLLSPADTSPPDFDKIAFNPATLFEREWSEGLGDLQRLAVQAILRPGVDGDVAGLLCASTEVRDRFEAILSRSAEDVGMSVQYTSEAEFIEALASRMG